MKRHIGISRETISDLRNGDHEAFEKVFKAYFSRVKVFICGYVKSDIDAEDIAEDVFVNLWINRASLDPSRSFYSYLHTVARNAALNFLRHKFICYSVPVPEELANRGLEDELIARETAMLVDMTVEKMSAQRQNIYRLSREEGLKNNEIAILLGTTKHNVESQLSLALKDIRKMLLILFLFVV
jgi:RNA polymerase sigma-70 factor (ECF subfamily)